MLSGTVEPRKRAVPYGDNFTYLKRGFIMKCPFCDTEMLAGYLNCGNAIWSERKHKISTLPGLNEKYALHLDVPALHPNYVESHCCPKCKRIIIDASDYEHNLD